MPRWAYLVSGAIAGAGVVAFTLVPEGIWPVVCIILMMWGTVALDRLTSRPPATPPSDGRRVAMVLHSVVSALLVITTLIIGGSIRGDESRSWLIWVLAAVAFAAMASLGWMAGARRPEHARQRETPSHA